MESAIPSIRRYPIHWGVGLTALAVWAIATRFYYAADKITAYGDAVSKLATAYRVFHNPNGISLAQIGGVWLPGHFFPVSFLVALFPQLFWNGLAGSLVSGATYIVGAVCTYESVRSLTKSRLGGLVTVMLVFLNPNVVYLATTAMSEVPFIMTLAVCLLAFTKWEETEEDNWMVLLAVVMTYGVLLRYEMWLIAAIASLVFVGSMFARGFRGWRIISRILAYGLIPAFGVIGWFFYEKTIFGNAFFFANGPYSAHSIEAVEGGRTWAVGHIGVAITEYLTTVQMNTGVWILVVALAGIPAYGITLIKDKKRYFSPLLLAGLPVATIASLYKGQSAIDLHTFYNVRYGTPLLLALGVGVGYLAAWMQQIDLQQWKRLSLSLGGIAVVACLMAPLWADPVNGPADLRITAPQYQEPGLIEFAQAFRSRYDRGQVLCETVRTNSMVQLRAHVPFEDYITEGNPVLFQQALVTPTQFVGWVLIKRGDTIDKRYMGDPSAYSDYSVVYENAYGKILQYTKPS